MVGDNVGNQEHFKELKRKNNYINLNGNLKIKLVDSIL